MNVFNYYVTEGNTEMNIIYKKNSEFENSQSNILTVYATGGRNIHLKLDKCFDTSCDPFNFADGSAITTYANNFDNFTLSITAEVGDYISVGAKIITKDGLSLGNILIPEMGQISGYLDRKIITKECYFLPEIDKTYYITGILYNGLAMYAFTGENLNPGELDFKIATRGFFSTIYNVIENERKYFCIQFFEKFSDNKIAYTLQIQSKQNFNPNYFGPQYTGLIYPRIIPTGSLVYINNIYPKIESSKIIYNMITTEGYPKMYLYSCKTYPSCDLDFDDLEINRNVERVDEINRMSSFVVDKENTSLSPIAAEQKILVVKCNKVQSEDYDHCEFMTSIFGNKEEVVLIESQSFGQYLLKDEENKF